MKRILACLATLALSATAIGAQAQGSGLGQTSDAGGGADWVIVSIPAAAPPATAPGAPTPAPVAAKPPYDPIGDVLAAAERSVLENAANWILKATLYHGGGAIRARDSLGCRVSPMRTVAVDPSIVSRRSIIFIKETVGLPLDGGGVHDGFWYASDIGGAIKGDRIDLFTGERAGSMRSLSGLNMKALTVTKVGDFSGCPPLDGGGGVKVADAR